MALENKFCVFFPIQRRFYSKCNLTEASFVTMKTALLIYLFYFGFHLNICRLKDFFFHFSSTHPQFKWKEIPLCVGLMYLCRISTTVYYYIEKKKIFSSFQHLVNDFDKLAKHKSLETLSPPPYRFSFIEAFELHASLSSLNLV